MLRDRARALGRLRGPACAGGTSARGRGRRFGEPGVDYRARILDEGLAILAGLWRGEPFAFAGEFCDLHETTFLPRPVQSPRIPVWVGGSWPNRPPLRRAVRWDGFHPGGRDGPLSVAEVAAITGEAAALRPAGDPLEIAIGDRPGAFPARAARPGAGHGASGGNMVAGEDGCTAGDGDGADRAAGAAVTAVEGAPRVLDAERRQQIVAFVDAHQGATVAELSRQFGVSAATVRRDLLQLDNLGLVERAHGGAVSRRARQQRGFPEPPIFDRAALMLEEKRRIGRAAAAYVADGDTIMIAGGTTTAHLIPPLAQRTGLTVVTNNLNVVGLLAPMTNLTVIMIGGVLRHSELSLHGALAEEALANVRVEKLFIGSSAIRVDYGLSADDPVEVQTDRLLFAAAREVIVLADHTKFDRVRTMRVAPMSLVTRVITDAGIASDQVDVLMQLGIPVDIV